ncbi:DUF3499 family protein [Curtobacterium sp. RRHDQ66]|jgi:hypothetical protein|uniref:DUF3499 family protein n=1 Tax=Curtobacterium TaxID=2034 RepID=UPI0007D72DFB|nr:DUF3499 family protein [Curtobacterium sp. 9128]SBN63929.1 Protein of unknown function (DUF3499) [Curtobacterium sp. 9128]
MDVRICSKVACGASASSTLTYDYGDSMVVVGPLSTRVEPHGYDLCARHAARLRVPQGWHVIRREPLREERAAD